MENRTRQKEPVTTRNTAWIRALSVLPLVALIAGCSQGMNDLRQYAERIKQRPGGRIEPIPQIKPYESYSYQVEEERSPFEKDVDMAEEQEKQEGAGDGITPDFNRNKEFLERFSLDGLTMKGTLTIGGEKYALIQDPDGKVHRVTTGDHMGQNYGEILRIAPNEITLNEIVPDGMGGWRERQTTLSLPEEQEAQ